MLVAVCEATHARHYTEDVVVDSVNAEVERCALRRLSETGRRDAVKHKGCRIDAGEVAGARRLVLLGLESKGIDVNWVNVRSVLKVRECERDCSSGRHVYSG